VIRSFADKRAQAIFGESVPKGVSRQVATATLKKLLLIHAAYALDDLRSPPGNRLEALKGNRSGQYSIRVNDQWRVCFRWHNGDAYDVELVDYH
jgi:proteic killer suppression protein